MRGQSQDKVNNHNGHEVKQGKAGTLKQGLREKAETPTPSMTGLTPSTTRPKDPVLSKGHAYHQQKQQSATAARPHTARTSTTTPDKKPALREGSTAEKKANPAPGKIALYYSNLMRDKKQSVGDSSAVRPTTKAVVIRNCAHTTRPPTGLDLNSTPGPTSNPVSTSVSTSVPVSAVVPVAGPAQAQSSTSSKKVNGHSNSIGAGDWATYYDALRKKLSLNSPKTTHPPSKKNPIAKAAAGQIVLHRDRPGNPVATSKVTHHPSVERKGNDSASAEGIQKVAMKPSPKAPVVSVNTEYI